MSRLWFYSVLIVAIAAIVFVHPVSAAQSVFIISKHAEPSLAQAYRISGDQVTYQGAVNIWAPDQGFGAVGCATWPEKGLVFFTYEDSGYITWASTKTLDKVGHFQTNKSIAGIAVDTIRKKIHVLQRNGNELYVYSWDEALQTLSPDGTYTLQNTNNALGLALDEANGRAYVTNNSTTVRY